MEEQEQRILAAQDITDEMRIQFAVDEFYEFVKTYDGDSEKIIRMKLMRNNILNMMDTYLKKFDNKLITKDFHERLLQAKNNATNHGKIIKYNQFMNEIRVVQEFKGINENIAQKLADQLIDIWRNSKIIPSKNLEEITGVIPDDVITSDNDNR